eukprot:432929-Amphidinium_carterae.1
MAMALKKAVSLGAFLPTSVPDIMLLLPPEPLSKLHGFAALRVRRTEKGGLRRKLRSHWLLA